VKAGGRERGDARDARTLLLGEAQRDASAQRVPDYEDIPAEALEGGAEEAIELREYRPGLERRRRPKAGEVEGQPSAAVAGQEVEDVPPGVGAVAEAVEEDERPPPPLQLEDARLVAGQLEPALAD